eukprot:CAMPEP_0174253710 /NCGR_PEP_ID=MMETSP0439-20130205/3077_1 /TAXON_ID=0 /ORGANISM="Stereomyxa ramosa, Strain Chinc5" /LENGTH=136 /DNA_ID=CAMNT_0015334887 /DNA_START=10 /DNA_END=420 /DNA_ORIENTATION=+
MADEDRAYIITTKDLWKPAVESGTYKPPSYEAEGFIHMSRPSQVNKVADRFYAGQTDLVLLHVDTQKLRDGELKYEEPIIPGSQRLKDEGVFATPEETFPHLYGTLDTSAVVFAELDFDKCVDEDGAYNWSDVREA